MKNFCIEELNCLAIHLKHEMYVSEPNWLKTDFEMRKNFLTLVQLIETKLTDKILK